jgi:hypothetical protein
LEISCERFICAFAALRNDAGQAQLLCAARSERSNELLCNLLKEHLNKSRALKGHGFSRAKKAEQIEYGFSRGGDVRPLFKAS